MGLFVKVKRSFDVGKAKAHVNYIAFRSREAPGEERGAFDRDHDHADVTRFREHLEDPLTRHPMATKAYKLTISLSDREFRALGLTSWKPVVREAMENLERKWGRQLDWIAAEHMAKGHPHVHVVIKGTCVDSTGRERQLRLDKVHLQELKQEIRWVAEKNRSLERERSMAKTDTLMRAFEAALRALSQPDHEEEHERETEHQRWLRGRRSRDDDRGR
ncbi:MAG TPA: hypothetical protein VK464_10390 [Symbiobacteriaceae bacterium]|nr:hypothetical protein [Symbiobacteriaceae bacterium]